MGEEAGMAEFLKVAHKHLIQWRGYEVWWHNDGGHAALGCLQWNNNKARRKHTLCALKIILHVSLFIAKLSRILTNLQGIPKHKFLHELAGFCHDTTDTITSTRTSPQQTRSKNERHGSFQSVPPCKIKVLRKCNHPLSRLCLLDIFTLPRGVKTTFLAAASKLRAHPCVMLHWFAYH